MTQLQEAIARWVVLLSASVLFVLAACDQDAPGTGWDSDTDAAEDGPAEDAVEDGEPDGTSDCDYPGAIGLYYDQRLDVGGETRSYLIFAPSSYDPCVATPMLIFFHGTDTALDPATNQEHYVNYTELVDTAEDNGFILVIPSGLRADDTYVGAALVWMWSGGITERNDEFVLAMLDEIPFQYHVDDSRIFFSGFSSGAHFSVHLLVHHGDLFAGCGVFAGSTSGESLGAAPAIIPAFLIVGADDASYVPEMQELRDVMLSVGWVLDETLSYEEVTGLGHEYPTPWFGGSRNQEMWDFFN